MECYFNNVVFEVTRRCNMQCPHCMRGPAQDLDLSKEDVDTFFDKVAPFRANGITFSGGEPTLNPSIISYIIDKLIDYKVVVGTLGLITNGQIFSKEIADALNRYDVFLKNQTCPGASLEYCSDRVGIGFSTDNNYHKPIDEKVRKQYQKYCKWLYVRDHFLPYYLVIKTGNSTFGMPFTYELHRKIYEVISFPNSDYKLINIKGNIYLTANGLVTTEGNGAFTDMDKCNCGHINDFDLIEFLMNYCEADGPDIFQATGLTRKMTQRGVQNEL